MRPKLLKSKKGFQIADVPQLGIVLVVVAVVLGIGMTILTQIAENTHCPAGMYWSSGNSMCYTGADFLNESRTLGFNATYDGMTGLNTLADWQETWAVIIW